MTLADPDHLQALEQLHWSHCHCSTQTKRVLETFIDICVDKCSLFTAPGAPDKHKTDKLLLHYCCGSYFLWWTGKFDISKFEGNTPTTIGHSLAVLCL